VPTRQAPILPSWVAFDGPDVPLPCDVVQGIFSGHRHGVRSEHVAFFSSSCTVAADMGRSARRPKAPPSGAVIFYGQSTQRDRSKQHQSNAPLSTVIPPPRKSQHGPTSPQLSIRSIRSSDTSSGDSSYELFDNASLGTSVSSLSEASDLNRNKSSILQSPTLRDNVATTIALIKFTVEMFQSAPYIEVIAGAVLQIIQIADVSFLIERDFTF
jgi:hypothetical protein